MKKTIAAIYLKSIVESRGTSSSLMDRFDETQGLKGKKVSSRMLNANVRKEGVAHGKIQ